MNGRGGLGLSLRATFLIGYAAVAVLISLTLLAFMRASDVVNNTPNVDEAHIVSWLSYIWLGSAFIGAHLVGFCHLPKLRRFVYWLPMALGGVLVVAMILVTWVKQTPQDANRIVEVSDQSFAIPRVYDPRRGEIDGQRFVDVSLCLPTGQGIYAGNCLRADDPVPLILRPTPVLRSAGAALDLERLGVPYDGNEIIEVPNAIDINKFTTDGYRGFSFRNIYLQHFLIDSSNMLYMHASCETKTQRCTITTRTDLGSLTYEVPGRGEIELDKWKEAAADYHGLFESWKCSGSQCKANPD